MDECHVARLRARAGMLVLAVVSVAVLAACGDDDDGGEATSTSSAVTTSAATAPATVSPTSAAAAATTLPPIPEAAGYTLESADGPLRQGLRGPRVQRLQAQLIALGYDPGTPDGLFGPKTVAAVRKFQTDKGLAADAVVGPRTTEALTAACQQQPGCPLG